MSSWDRQAVLERFGALFAAAENEEALAEELGTPTKQAIELARTYVPSPAPRRSEAAPEVSAEPEVSVPEQFTMDLTPEQAEPVPEKKTVRKVSGGALAVYLIPAIVIGLPVTVALVCVGVPFLAGGAALIVEAVKTALSVIAALALVSDILVTLGGALVLCALGLLLCWLGIWISVELGCLWVEKVLLALGRKLCVKEVAA